MNAALENRLDIDTSMHHDDKGNHALKHQADLEGLAKHVTTFIIIPHPPLHVLVGGTSCYSPYKHLHKSRTQNITAQRKPSFHTPIAPFTGTIVT